ncbi:MAG: hypothetical protein EKK49_05390 [Rhodocyclaceae bacterium]|nr:MAG: hypothetical protein EKK49_05390 [Rhodocyclaceae bacterium]
MRLMLSIVGTTALLSGCERLGIPDPSKAAAQTEAEGKAIGSACRHAGRAIEDCFTLNQGASKASVFAGWKEMNDYMAENKISEVAPQLPPPPPPTPPGTKPAKAKSVDADTQNDATDSEDGTKNDADSAAADETPRKRRRAKE